MIATRSSDHGNLPRHKATVVLLHGIGGNSWLMESLAKRLRNEQMNVENWGYWSIGWSLESIIAWFENRLSQLLSGVHPEQPVHIVAHSMGGIVTRAVAAELILPPASRIVMVSPPNRGSHVATRLGPKLRWLTPAVAELADHPDSFVNRLPSIIPAEVGIIAAGSDRVVRQGSTHLDNETDHITLAAGHTEVLFRTETAHQVVHFLDHGRFHRETCKLCQPNHLIELQESTSAIADEPCLE